MRSIVHIFKKQGHFPCYNREELIPSESSNLDTDSKYTKLNKQFIKQRRQYNTRIKKEKQKKIVNITCPQGKQKYRDRHESTNETDSNNSYEVSNYNTESDWTPQDASSENSPTRNKVDINSHIKQNNKNQNIVKSIVTNLRVLYKDTLPIQKIIYPGERK